MDIKQSPMGTNQFLIWGEVIGNKRVQEEGKKQNDEKGKDQRRERNRNVY